MKKLTQDQLLNAPLLHNSHKRPVTRRDFIAQGFAAGTASVMAPSILGLFANPQSASAALSSDIEALKSACGIAVQGAGKIPFICFDFIKQYDVCLYCLHVSMIQIPLIFQYT